MENIKSAVFTKNDWMKAYLWQCDRIEEGFDNIASTYANGKIVKIATKNPITSQEQRVMADQLLTTI